MPRKLTVDSLQAEAASLNAILNEAREYGDVVGEMQCEERLQQIEEELADLVSDSAPFASVALFFSGKPVFGSRGMAAQFAGRVLDYYQELVSRTYAAKEVGIIAQRGRAPLKKISELMVTGLTHGSFGFVLEELSEQQEIHDTALKEVISYVSGLLLSVGSQELNESDRAIEQLDARTLVALRDFYKALDTSEATLRVVEDLAEYTLDSNTIQRGRERTENIEIDERRDSILGELVGFLPDHRRFELRDATGTVIYGSATEQAGEQFAAAITAGKQVIGKLCTCTVQIREIRPINRPPRLTYKLIEFLRLSG